ncbi:hypothetical protein [Dyadobacter alkalitolerans]|uniref:hypothetical protein n=1 Tax=Dyadobacter alkalitolerans TaxID=492736 RepID=UPI00041AA0D9|nr:hypothetical protein [Dyadobacter alkalitolerans]
MNTKDRAKLSILKTLDQYHLTKMSNTEPIPSKELPRIIVVTLRGLLRSDFTWNTVLIITFILYGFRTRIAALYSMNEIELGTFTTILIGSGISALGLSIYSFLTGNSILSKTFEKEENDKLINEKLNELIRLTRDRTNIPDNAPSKIFSDAEKSELLSQIKDELKHIISSVQVTSDPVSFQDFISNKSVQLIDIEQDIVNSKDRMIQQIRKLEQKASVNLAIGCATSVGAMFILYSTYADRTETFTTIYEAIRYYSPRLSTVIFVELFSFFFLRLHRATIHDIKYFQNEITNLELKYLSLKTSMFYNDKKLVHEVLKSLHTDERNFVLKKGESTVGLESLKMGDQSDRSFLEGIRWVLDNSQHSVKSRLRSTNSRPKTSMSE